jgi:peptidoglycan/xylan/chitin deacetylase (PgdA/CDA1 family)
MRLLLLLLLSIGTASAQERFVAFTMDDLPFVGTDDSALTHTKKILSHFSAFKVPAVGFVNDQFIANRKESGTLILEEWIKHKQELGNHTYSHPSFTKSTLAEYVKDVKKGNEYSNALQRKSTGKSMRYFRHPYLHTGDDSTKKRGLDKTLKELKLQAVPVTMDGSDWYFNHAAMKSEPELAKRIGQAYVEFTLASIEYSEKLALEVNGSPIKHIFLTHANSLNAIYLKDILAALYKKGYTFISVEEAMKDPVYLRPDTVLAPGGFSWLHRWRISAKQKTALKEPEIPKFVQEAYEK